MKMKLTTLLFGLLLAVGWTSSASAQKLDESKMKSFTEIAILGNRDAGLNSVANPNGRLNAPNRAPNRAENTITASATHEKSWYDAITYDWVDANGNPHNNKITDAATDPYQIAYLLGTTYMNPVIPGTKYTAVNDLDNPYPDVAWGWDIPNNARWNYEGSIVPAYGDIVITPYSTISNYLDYIEIYSILVKSGDNTLSFFDIETTGGMIPMGWSFNGSWSLNGNYIYTNSSSANITISGEALKGYSDITITVVARTYQYSNNRADYVRVNNVNGNRLQSTNTTSTWNISSNGTEKGVTKPYENGYTIFLVKVHDNVGAAPFYTHNWNSGSDNLINYFTTYIEEVQLLTDGTRLNEGTDDAGTMFSYSGELNRFYFVGKGKNYFWQNDESDEEYGAGAPTYNMYEEFSPTTTDNGAQTTDFYSKLLYGNSYNVLHDCRNMNYLQHYFTMSGLAGDQHRSMTNLIFWIPDNRASYLERNYNEEFLPHVGLYTITLEADAEQVAQNYVEGNRNFKVTCDWVSSLNSILDFDVDQDYELWIYTYDTQGNPVAKEKVTDLIVDENGYIHNDTEHFYYVEQKPESYTIVYRIKGWPKDATNTPGHHQEDPENGTFYALSNLAPVIIPGYNDFLSLGVEHYESDFALDVLPEFAEHNYYRNFLTLGNQNPEKPLTAARIQNNENHFELYRYNPDIVDENQKPLLYKAADLVFSLGDNKVEYDITYADQSYVDEAELTYVDENNVSHNITGYSNHDDLGCPTHGVIANISEGGSSTPPPATYDDITIQPSGMDVNFTRIAVVSGNTTITEWVYPTSSLNSDWSCTSSFNVSTNYGGGYTSGTITIPGELLNGYENVQVKITAWGDYSTTAITVSGSRTTIGTTSNTYTWDITPNNGNSGFRLLNNFLDNSTYTQVGIVVFELPWKSIQVKLQEGETTESGSTTITSAGYFFIQNGGRLRFVMPAGYNNANLKFVIHNAPVSSEYHDGTFTLKSSNGDTQTIEFPNTTGDADREVIFEHVNSGDVITITGTHYENGTLYNYSPDFKYIHVFVEGGNDGVGMNDALNLNAIKFVDQFKEETKEDKHAKFIGYVLKLVGSTEESGRPEIPVQHTNSIANGFYTLSEIQNDTKAPLLQVNVMNADVNMTLARDPEIYYYTLGRKPNTATTWEELSKLQRREDDSYQEMYDKLDQYDDQVCTPPADATAVWNVERYDTNIMTGAYNSYMSYVPVIWTFGDQSTNRRVKWNTENKHNSYGSPIWKTGVAEVVLTSATAERQNSASTNWTYGGQDCSLYMLDKIFATATMPTVNNVKYVPYMFRIFVKSKNKKLRGYTQVLQGEGQYDGEHYEGAPIDDESLQCVWSTYLNESTADLESKGVTIGITEANGVKTITFEKKKKDRTGGSDANPMGDWDQEDEVNAIFAGLKDIITGEGNNMSIDADDLTIFVRFYYILEGMMPTTNTLRAGDGNPGAGYGAEGSKAPDPATSVDEILYHGEIVSQTYVNTQGMQSDRPFDGVNIVVTRFSDGTTSVSKVVR